MMDVKEQRILSRNKQQTTAFMKFFGTSENLLRETKIFREITLSNNVDRFLFAKQTAIKTKPVWINWGYLKSVPRDRTSNRKCETDSWHLSSFHAI